MTIGFWVDDLMAGQQQTPSDFFGYLRPRLKLTLLFIPFVLVLPLGTAYWSPPKELSGDALSTATYLSSLAAFTAAILVGHLVTALIGAALRYWIIEGRSPSGPADEPVTPAIVGALERSIYVYAFYLGLPEAIAVWLAFKAVGRWQAQERAQFNTFLILSAISLFFGFLGAAIVAGDPF